MSFFSFIPPVFKIRIIQHHIAYFSKLSKPSWGVPKVTTTGNYWTHTPCSHDAQNSHGGGAPSAEKLSDRPYKDPALNRQSRVPGLSQRHAILRNWPKAAEKSNTNRLQENCPGSAGLEDKIQQTRPLSAPQCILVGEKPSQNKIILILSPGTFSLTLCCTEPPHGTNIWRRCGLRLRHSSHRSIVSF